MSWDLFGSSTMHETSDENKGNYDNMVATNRGIWVYIYLLSVFIYFILVDYLLKSGCHKQYKDVTHYMACFV